MNICKVCHYYNHVDKTCSRARGPAKVVRKDPSKCGPKGKWFMESFGKDGLNPEMNNVFLKESATHQVQ